MQNIALLIPAFNPNEDLLDLVDELLRLGFRHVVVVNDGSEPGRGPLFEALSGKCVVLTHAANLGKGRALKTGLNHIYLNFPSLDGVVTVDADGQHHPEDAVTAARMLETNGKRTLVIGQRKLSGSIPLRSLIGNLVTRYVFYALTGKMIRDTQSGLRGLTRDILPELIGLKGEGYEYEMNMLMHCREKSIDIREVGMRTIYLEDNRSSHFNPFFDSMKIYFLFLRFLSSSLFSSMVDLIIYSFLILQDVSLPVSILVARSLSSFLNFLINKGYVFKKEGNFYFHLAGYYTLVVFIAFFSYVLIGMLNTYLGIHLIAAKIISETFLFVLSFVVQRDLVFPSFKK